MILFFRGKAATGKSMAAMAIAEAHTFKVIHKDSVFDELLEKGYDWRTATQMAYDRLAIIIQRNHDAELNLIVDIGLAHTPYFHTFLSKLTLKPERVRYFLFDCSDEAIWQKRIENRIQSPSASNQAFKTVEEATEHYKRYEISLIENEKWIDSSQTMEKMMEDITWM